FFDAENVDGKREPLYLSNPQVSIGLSDIIAKCLAPNQRARYPDAANLAADLHRFLEDRPLKGVANRSLHERWRKWRRRRPYLLPLIVVGFGLFGALATTWSVSAARTEDRRRQAETALYDGQERFRARRYGEAVQTLTRGLEQAESLPGEM